MKEGWLRIQNVPPSYILIDFHVPLNAAQTDVVGQFFENRYERIVVESQGESQEFVDGDEAMGYVLKRM